MTGATLCPDDLAALHVAGLLAVHFQVDVDAVIDALMSAPVPPLSLLDRPEGLTALGEYMRGRVSCDGAGYMLAASPYMVTIH